jgi:hypothetical protein
MRLYALVEAGDPEAIDVYLCEQDAQRIRDGSTSRRDQHFLPLRGQPPDT